MRAIIIAATLALVTLAPTASAGPVDVEPCEGGYKVTLLGGQTQCYPGLGATRVYACDSPTEVGIEIAGNDLGCVGNDSFVEYCEGGVLIRLHHAFERCVTLPQV